MTSDNIKSGVYLAALGAAAFVAWKAYKGAGAVGDKAAAAWDSVTESAAKVGGWVNPASDQNLVYQAVNAAGSGYTGQGDWTLGGAVYDLSHPGPAASVGTTDEYDPMGNFIGTFRGGYSLPTGSNGQPPQKGVTGTW